MSGRWQKLKNPPSTDGTRIKVSTMLLATDGTVRADDPLLDDGAAAQD